jgi:hypothetical protein
MKNQPIVLCDEDLADIQGGDLGSMVASAIIDYIISKAIPAAASAVGSGLSAVNSYLGPPGTYNPYSNPINCEYAGYY